MDHKIQWVIDNCLLERHDEEFGFPTIEEAVRQQGHDCFITKYVPFSIKPDFDFNLLDTKRPVVIYGSIQFAQQIDRYGVLKRMGIAPGLYFRKNELKFSSYSSIYGEWMLNNDYFMLPYGEFKRRIKEDIHDGLYPPHYKDHKIFLRPDVVTKSFAGRVFDFDSQEDDIDALDKYEKIADYELCIIAEPKKIISEFRHVVVDREIVAQSQYRRDSLLDIRVDVEPSCQSLVKYICNQDYEMDRVFVIDTALTLDGPRIVEFNAFSCSGLYACDTNNIVKRVSEAACFEFYGENF